MRYPTQKAIRAKTNTIVAAGMSLIWAEVALTLSAVVATRNRTNCCKVLSTTRPLICMAMFSFYSVGSMASPRNRALATTKMPSKSGITAKALAWRAYPRRIGISASKGLLGQSQKIAVTAATIVSTPLAELMATIFCSLLMAQILPFAIRWGAQQRRDKPYYARRSLDV